MANAKQASLILQLIDKVSGPAKGIVGSLNLVNTAVRGFTGAAMAPTRALVSAGRSFRRHSTDVAGASVPLALGLGKAADAVYGFEKAGNRMQAFGLLTDPQRQRLEDEAQFLNKLFPQTNKGIIEAAGELFRAGLNYEQALGALKGTLQLSLAGDIDTQRAADIATNIMYAMKLPMETYEQVQSSLQRVNDLLAYGATKSNTDIGLMSDTFRYVAPLAATAGMQIEEVTGLTMELARAGIKGAEAGVALRSALVRMAKPTKPMMSAFGRLGIQMEDFVKYKDRIEASSIVASLMPEGYDLRGMAGEIQAVLDDKSLAAAPERMVAQLSDLIVGAIGDEAVRDNVSSALTDAVMAGAQQVDLLKLLKTLREKNATITDIAQIFDVRMGSRLAAILYSDLDKVVGDVSKNFGGTSAKMSEAMIKGIVGVVLELEAALENLAITLADSGVLTTVSETLKGATAFISELSKANPQMLEFGTYGGMALAAMAPLGLALSGMASALALVANPLSWVAAGLGYLAYQNWDSLIAFGNGFRLGFLDNLDPNTIAAFENLASNIGVWMGDINTALSDQGAMGAGGTWFGAKVAGEINAFVRDIHNLKAEIQALVDWWNGKGESPIKLQATDGPMGDFWQNLGSMDTGKFLRHYLLPDAWNPDISMDEYLAETRAAGEQANQALSVVATPIVNSSSIDAALAKAHSLNAALRGIGASATPPPPSGKFGGARAEGGPVRRGLTYLVGEQGPELFSPGQSGGITSNHALGGGGGPLIGSLHIHGASANEVMAKLGATLDRALERSRQLSLDGRPVTT